MLRLRLLKPIARLCLKPVFVLMFVLLCLWWDMRAQVHLPYLVFLSIIMRGNLSSLNLCVLLLPFRLFVEPTWKESVLHWGYLREILYRAESLPVWHKSRTQPSTCFCILWDWFVSQMSIGLRTSILESDLGERQNRSCVTFLSQNKIITNIPNLDPTSTGWNRACAKGEHSWTTHEVRNDSLTSKPWIFLDLSRRFALMCLRVPTLVAFTHLTVILYFF